MQEKLFFDEVTDTLSVFGEKVKLINYGFPDDDYVKNGFLIKLELNNPIRIKEYTYRSAKFKIRGSYVTVTAKGLNDIKCGLAQLIQ